MAQEIERKFLVTGEFKSLAFAQSRIVQGYISSARGVLFGFVFGMTRGI